MPEPNRSLGYDAVLKALKAHSNAIPGVTEEELDEGFEAFKKETDRGAVILGATTLEDKLAERLQSQMPHLNSDELSRLFGWDGPMGTFSAKVRMAHALGHLDRATFKMAEVVREMRNACAHSRQDISFKDEALRDAVLLLGKMAKAELPAKADADSLRFYFLTFVAWLVHYIYAKEDRPSFGKWIVKLVAIYREMHPSSDDLRLERLAPKNPGSHRDA